ncbi:MAG: hypothetical protein ACUVRD_07080 [Bacteroidia bacterium]
MPRWILTCVSLLIAQHVGIGTYNPSHKLHIAGPTPANLRLEDLSSPNGAIATLSATGVVGKENLTATDQQALLGNLSFGPDPTDWKIIGNTNSDPTTHFLGTTDAQPLIFKTQNTERMRIKPALDANGLVWINTTTNPPVVSNNIVAIVAGSFSRALRVEADNATAIVGISDPGASAGVGPGAAGVISSNIDQSVAVFGRGNNLTTFFSPPGTPPTLGHGATYGVYGYATNTALDPRAGGYFSNHDATIWAQVGARQSGQNYKIIGSGSVSTIVHDGQGGLRMMTAPEAPDALFLDFGIATLQEGRAYVALDPILLHNIDTSDVHIWLTPRGPCLGIYVEAFDGKGFYVRERKGGKSTLSFHWAIAATRLPKYQRAPLIPNPPAHNTSSNP